MCLKVAFSDTFVDRGQKHIETPIKHLKWNFFAKILKPLTIYAKAPSWMYDYMF